MLISLENPETNYQYPQKINLPLPLVTFEEPYMVFTFPRSGDAVKLISEDKKPQQLNEDEILG